MCIATCEKVTHTSGCGAGVSGFGITAAASAGLVS
jgi:hypothetical protein